MNFMLTYCVISQNVFVVSNVTAYLDPGTGSFLLQLLLGALFGSIFVIKIYWHKCVSFFANLFSRKQKNETTKK